MKLPVWLRTLKYYGQFIPIRIPFLFCLLLIWTAWYWIHHSVTTSSSFHGIILLMAQIALLFSVAIISFCLLSVLLCYFLFIYQVKKHPERIIEMDLDTDAHRVHVLKIHTRLPYARRPLLGFVKMKLIYNRHQYTGTCLLSERVKPGWFVFNGGVAGHNRLLLPDIREYYFSKALISFEDMLQFFSFTLALPFQRNLSNLPTSLFKDTDELLPKKTEEEKVRIEQLRKVEGEWLHYKKFENSDDVRRIVWKIFAKNKELMVRIPEIMDPFASHIYFYASFYNANTSVLVSGFQQEMINHYKNCVWTLLDALKQKEYEVRYISDQSIPSADRHPLEAIQLTRSEWQNEFPLHSYFKPRQGSVLCIHSFTPPDELKTLLSACDPETVIYFIPLSRILKSNYLLNWILRIFIKPQPDRLSSLRNRWAIHPLKFQTLKAENTLLQLLQKSEIPFDIIP